MEFTARARPESRGWPTKNIERLVSNDRYARQVHRRPQVGCATADDLRLFRAVQYRRPDNPTRSGCRDEGGRDRSVCVPGVAAGCLAQAHEEQELLGHGQATTRWDQLDVEA